MRVITIIVVAALVCLSGCSAMTDFFPDDTEVESNPTETVSPTRNTPSTTVTNSQTVGENPGPSIPASTEISQLLPFSSDLPVSGYLRTNEETFSGSEEGQVRVATRYFERTDKATAEGPSEVTSTVKLFESRQAATTFVSTRLENYRANNSSISFSSTPVDAPVVQVVPSDTSDESRTISLVQYGNVVIVIESHSQSGQYLGFSRDVVDVILLKIESASP